MPRSKHQQSSKVIATRLPAKQLMTKKKTNTTINSTTKNFFFRHMTRQQLVNSLAEMGILVPATMTIDILRSLYESNINVNVDKNQNHMHHYSTTSEGEAHQLDDMLIDVIAGDKKDGPSNVIASAVRTAGGKVQYDTGDDEDENDSYTHIQPFQKVTNKSDGAFSQTHATRRCTTKNYSDHERLNFPIDRIDDIVIHLLDNTIATSSKSSYSSGYKLFIRFAVMSGFNLQSNSLPPRLLLRFIAFCHGIQKIQYSTIRCYLAAIRFYRLQAGFPDPFLNSNGAYIPQLEMALRGSRRLCGRPTKQCKPITLDLLLQLVVTLQSGVFNPYVDVLMQAALTTAFWGFFRSGELFPDTFIPHLHVIYSDVKFETFTVVIHLKTSKVDVEKKGIYVRLFKTNTIGCAVHALTNFNRIRSDQHGDSPYFLLPNGQPLTRRAFVNNLRHLLLRVGVQPSGYSGHSMRVGAATSAAAAGVADYLIQVLGRWSSLSYLRYIRVSNEVIQQAHDKILLVSV